MTSLKERRPVAVFKEERSGAMRQIYPVGSDEALPPEKIQDIRISCILDGAYPSQDEGWIQLDWRQVIGRQPLFIDIEGEGTTWITGFAEELCQIVPNATVILYEPNMAEE